MVKFKNLYSICSDCLAPFLPNYSNVIYVLINEFYFVFLKKESESFIIVVNMKSLKINSVGALTPELRNSLKVVKNVFLLVRGGKRYSSAVISLFLFLFFLLCTGCGLFAEMYICFLLSSEFQFHYFTNRSIDIFYVFIIRSK